MEYQERTGTRATVPSGLAEALLVAEQYDTRVGTGWHALDDQCDCVYQRIGKWDNPYLGETLEVRLCCAWAFLFAQFPEMAQFQRVTHVYTDPNTGTVATAPRAWDSKEGAMPRAIWLRHLARKLDKPLSAVRELYQGMRPPEALR